MISNAEFLHWSDKMTIYKGKKAVCGILLTIDRVWRYVLSAEDTLTVRITDSAGNAITKTYGKADVDPETKYITVELQPEDTAGMSLGRGKLSAVMNDLVVVRPTRIMVKEV